MSILLVDIGNTRVKWARLKRGRLQRQRAAAHAGWRAADFSRHVFKSAGEIEQIVVASVAGLRLNDALVTASRKACGIAPRFVKTQRRTAGVTTLYEEPWRLGVDRFVAVIGARRLVPGRSVCVVDVGTAMTLDLLDGAGKHRGGAIVPGPQLMIESLRADTSGIERRSRGAAAGRALFARNTRAAIEQGARYACAAVIERAVTEARRILQEIPAVILTGGGAPALRRTLRVRHQLVPDLVLRGLAEIVMHK